ncbi:MAG: aminotransferase class IV [Verrucomicrobiales bacterium]|jgi:branched-subunit amino acid aminotransferase/4-amino-4-deoxychorismate lyase|nr:aminotransferase class IV [Verrucomicrobiales bacterium]
MSMVDVEDLGFRHGYGVFETLTVSGGRARLRDWHEENLREAASVLGISAPDLSPLTLTPPGEGIWRWFLTPSGLRTWFAPGLAPLPVSYRVELSPLRVSSSAWDARFKTLGYLTHYQARMQSGGDEALLLNERGEVAAAAMANIFWVRNGALFTPSTECGCRGGTVRRWVLENFSGEALRVSAPLTVMQEADEIFLTNSRVGVMPVTELTVGGTRRQLAVGELTGRLRERFRSAMA